jgi:hypothetical protein
MNPAPQVPDRMNCLNLFCVLLFMPLDALMMSTMTPGSSPKRLPATTASHAASRPAADT